MKVPNVVRRMVGVLLLLAAFPTVAQDSKVLPDDAKKTLEALPNKAVDLDLVVALAMKNSDAFRSAVAQRIAVDAPKLNVQGAFAPRLTGSYTQIDDKNETAGAFSPRETDIETYRFGVEKKFVTGTQLAAEYSNNNNDLLFKPGIPPDFLPPTSYYESTLSLSVTQSLIQDFLGETSMKLVEAADLQSEALKVGVQEAIEGWHSDLSQLFYQAWLAQQRYEVASQNLAAQKRVLGITQVQVRRGTAKTQQLIQIRGAETNASFQLAAMEQELWNIWRMLVETLKLPADWAKIHPSLVPMTVANPSALLDDQCQKVLSGDQVKTVGTTVERLRKQVKALDLQLAADKKQLGPEAFLQGQLITNGYDTEASDTARTETFSGDHPRWAITLGVQWNLGQQTEKAQLVTNLAEQTQAQAQLAMLEGQNKVSWTNGCRNLLRLSEQVEKLEKEVVDQKRRVRLEEREFGIGRLPALNILQAILDSTQAQINYASAQAELRMQAWELLRLSGALPAYLRELTERNYKLAADE